jgi:hypothetical protein
MLEKDNHFSLFPQLIGAYQFEKHEELKDRISDLFEKYSGTDKEQHSETGTRHLFNDYRQNLFEECVNGTSDVLIDFRDFCITKSLLYADMLGLDHPGFQITDAWVNHSDKGAFLQPHNHANSFFSATYYLNFDPEKHSKVTFRNPYYPSVFGGPYLNIEHRSGIRNHMNSHTYECDICKEGYLLIWQSGMIHAYEPNQGDGRETISMNFFPRYLKTGPYSVVFESSK